MRNLCTNCLNGTLRGGICTNCHKSAQDAANRPMHALPARSMLGNRYYLGRVIGNGGFGITYLSWDWIEKRRVIVKELCPRQDVRRDTATGRLLPVKGQEAFYEKCKQRFREEAQVLYSFRDEPAVVDVYRLLEENNTVYYSMEYLTGFDMKTYLQQHKRMEWQMLSGYVKNILHTLHILHGRGLIHRDISPDNIFLNSMDDAKLIDFGSVRCFNNGQGLTTLLKLAYAPIEQYFTNGNQGPWTDIYSLCVTMYHALSGTCPPRASDRARKDGVVPIQQLCPQLPGHVARVIGRGMGIRPEERYQSVAAMAAELFPNENIFARRQPAAGRAAGGFSLTCISGVFRGRAFQVPAGQEFLLGRDKSKCSIYYPVNCTHVSKVHARLKCQDGQPVRLYIRDEHSTNGTAVSGRYLEPGEWHLLNRGDVVSFAGESYLVQ